MHLAYPKLAKLLDKIGSMCRRKPREYFGLCTFILLAVWTKPPLYINTGKVLHTHTKHLGHNMFGAIVTLNLLQIESMERHSRSDAPHISKFSQIAWENWFHVQKQALRIGLCTFKLLAVHTHAKFHILKSKDIAHNMFGTAHRMKNGETSSERCTSISKFSQIAGQDWFHVQKRTLRNFCSVQNPIIGHVLSTIWATTAFLLTLAENLPLRLLPAVGK